MKEKTMKDFDKLIEQAKERFSHNKMIHGWNFTSKKENYNEIIVFTIANNVMATKIMFDTSMKHIVSRDIYISDIKLINTMLSELNTENEEWNS